MPLSSLIRCAPTGAGESLTAFYYCPLMIFIELERNNRYIRRVVSV